MFVEVAIILFTMYLFWFVLTTRRQRKMMPPGPFPLPIIGNMHLIGSNPPFSMKPLDEKYGGIYTVTTPMGQIVFVNNGEIAKEGLITKGLDFAGRLGKETFPANHLVEGKGLLFGKYSLALLSLRKIVTSAMHLFGEKKKEAEKRICRETDLLLERVEATNGEPFNPMPHLAATTINMIVQWLFSTRYDYNDLKITMLLEFTEDMGKFLRQGSIHQIFPILQRLPTPFMKKLEKWREQRDRYFKVMFAERKETYSDGIVRDITDALIAFYLKKRSSNEKDTVDDCVFLVIDIFAATSDTAKTVLTWLCLYLITFPKVQRKAQEEIDRVIGRDRLPEYKDQKNLPYIEALIAETLRYSTFNPIFPRKATCDATLCGYNIPKDTDVFFNVWGIHHDPNVWVNPNEFNSDRFLDKNGQFLGWNLLNFFPFGGGRRMCLGASLGKIKVFVVASRLLHQFRFEMVENEPKPSLVGVVSSVLIPESYNLRAIKRS